MNIVKLMLATLFFIVGIVSAIVIVISLIACIWTGDIFYAKVLGTSVVVFIVWYIVFLIMES